MLRLQVRRFSERWRQREQQQAAATVAGTKPTVPSSSAAAAASQPAAFAPKAAAAAAPAGSDEVSVEQLIVGVLLFTPLLGLFPTAAAWYLSVCCCHGALLLARLVLVGLGRLLRLRLLQLLLIRWSEPQRFPGQLMVQPMTPLHSSSSSSSRVIEAFGVLHSATLRTGAAGTSQGAAGGCTAAEGADASADGSAGQKQRQQQKDETLLPVYYHLYCDPRGYAEAVTSFLAQQAAGSSQHSASCATCVVGLVKAVVRGELWGVGLYCRS
jgi:hypothetical protein